MNDNISTVRLLIERTFVYSVEVYLGVIRALYSGPYHSPPDKKAIGPEDLNGSPTITVYI